VNSIAAMQAFVGGWEWLTLLQICVHSDFGCPFLLLTGFTLQVWALAIGKKSEMLATGGRDAVLNLWYDCTADDKEELFRKEVSCLTCYF
jgi:hypothetical protein